ncbi:hypothetical protein [Vagococcus sp. WN89Y]|uniref:hypothetical protein n=1 Tax=Vagococcus sp. WN89Y TaxID=3457258 RepID=UPI003FCD03E5
MKCKGVFTFADNHTESGMIRVNVLDQYMLSFDMEIVRTYKLRITWRSEEQIAEDKKRLIEIDKEANEILAHPSYKYIYLSLNSDGDLNHRIRIVSKPAACGNNPYDKYYPGFDDLIEEKVELQHNIQRAEKD